MGYTRAQSQYLFPIVKVAEPSSGDRDLSSRLNSYVLRIAAFWTAAVVASLIWNVSNIKHNTRLVAHGQAQASFEKDVAYRLWVAQRGGVYVPSDKTSPSPYLHHVRERDIVTPEGKRLTLVNGAYMTREVHEMASEMFGARAHITSLKLVREKNAPDPWERRALESFEQGAKEIADFEDIDGKSYYRFMRPLKTEENCLKCHQKDGYMVGDVRGGISVSIPMEPLRKAERGPLMAISTGHVLLWLLGLGAVILLSRRLQEQVVQRENVECALTESERRLDYLVSYDPLTRLPNRALFHDSLSQALARVKQGGGMVAVLLIDLDHFKNVNDALGHAAGDRLIQTIAARLIVCAKEGDIVARLGGDEFAIIMENFGSEAALEAGARRLIDAISAPVELEGRELYVGASIGISLYPTDGTDAGMLMMNADTALYLAKEKGRGNCQFFTNDLNRNLEKNLSLENRLRHAIERDELVLYFQPKVDVVGSRIMGTEALLRWQHPELGLVPPMDFIPLAETSGLIIPIGEWVLRAACRQNKAWQDAGHSRVTVAVNLSARQFRQANLVEMVADILEETGLEAEFLELEITESVMMENPEEAIAVLKRLSNLGLRLSVDDFGTGYSSLSYLKQFPLSYLKIDRSFVRDIIDDRNDAAIAAAVIGLARDLNLQVIAEGVETEEQRAFLQKLRCDYAQGYLFGKPVAPDELFKNSQ